VENSGLIHLPILGLVTIRSRAIAPSYVRVPQFHRTYYYYDLF
jgi:hypothetical protein